MPRTSAGYSKSQVETAERVVVRYDNGYGPIAARIFNTALFEKAELEFVVAHAVKRLKAEGRKGVEVIRWTPKVV